MDFGFEAVETPTAVVVAEVGVGVGVGPVAGQKAGYSLDGGSLVVGAASVAVSVFLAVVAPPVPLELVPLRGLSGDAFFYS